MATAFAHAAIPLLTRKAFEWPSGFERRLAIASVACAVWPDLDLGTLLFEVRSNELLGHRGLTHSLLVAGIVALLVAAPVFRALHIGSRAWWRVVLFLFAAGASHGLLDAMTTGEIGVALFAPLENGRHMLPLALIPSSPVGLNEFLGSWGALTLANEVLYVVIPLALVTTYFGVDAPRRRVVIMAVVWFVTMIVLRRAQPDSFTPTAPRILQPIGTPLAGSLDDIPREDLPEQKLVTRLSELRSRDLFDNALAPASPAWSSSFFPFWFGSEAGRWMDGTPRLAWRTLVGFSAPSENEARGWLASAAAGDAAARRALFSLSPTEKVDLALGRFDFPATEQALGRTHNAKPKPRYWQGRCNGVAAAALALPEPFRVVDVIAADGSHVRFHPNDVKSLLALAYEGTSQIVIGDVCGTVAFDAGAICSMNPAVLVVALLNRLGIAKRSFLIDALPTLAKQYYAVASARVHLAREPRPPGNAPMAPALAGKVDSVVDVEIELTLSSTTLPYARADRAQGENRYERVGLVPVVMKYSATLALDASSELVGGLWTGSPADGPDDILIVGSEPGHAAGGKLDAADRIPWSFVRELARASVDESSALPALDLRTQCDGRCAD